MSLVKIQGNVNGTGVLTIEAPNTNTDRTMTLPDVAGEILTDATGLTSSSSLNADNLSSGTLPSARFPSALPAVSAQNLTNIPAANITGTLPAIDGSNLTGIEALPSQTNNAGKYLVTDGTNASWVGTNLGILDRSGSTINVGLTSGTTLEITDRAGSTVSIGLTI